MKGNRWITALTAGKQAMVVAIVILAAICLLHINDWFLSDDYVLIGRISQHGLYASWGRDTGGFLRPLTVLSLWLDYSVWGLRSIGYHLTGFLLYLATVVVTFFLALEFCRISRSTCSKEIALFASALFAILPCHSEPLLWVSARADLLSTLLGVASCVAFTRMCRKGSASYGTSALLLFAAGLAAKETLVSIPVIWLLIAVWPYENSLGSTRRQRAYVLLLSLGILSAYLIARRFILGTFIGGLGTARHLGISLDSLIENLVRYTIRVLIPPMDLPELTGVSVLVLLAVAVVVVMRLIRHERSSAPMKASLLAGLLFLAALMPVLTLRIGVMDTQSERYLFFPGVFICIGLAAVVRNPNFSGRFSTFLLMALVLVSGAGLFGVSFRWCRAVELSEELSLQLAGLEPDENVVMNLPDNYRGVYIFRNGVEAATTIFRDGLGAPEVLWIHEMDRCDESYLVELLGDSVRLVLPDTAVTFPKRRGIDYYFFDGESLRTVK